MVNNFDHQTTIGIIGATPDAQQFVLEAKKLGLMTVLLCRTENEAKRMYGMDKTYIGSLENERIREEFIMAIDLLVYYDDTVNAVDIAELKRTVVIPQGDDLLAIAQDQVLQKAFFESLSMNISPYVTVVKPEDIEEGLKSIGYPAILTRNQSDVDAKKKFFIYEESDIEEATSLLKYGTYVLESWITSEQQLSITAVRNGQGNVILFPIVNMTYREDQLANLFISNDLDEELANEIHRITHIILNEIEFQGAVSLDFFVTPADALYVGSIQAYPNMLSRYTEQASDVSATEAHLKAISSMPLPEKLSIDYTVVFVPFYEQQKEIIDELIMTEPEWDFTFYTISKEEGMQIREALGHIVIRTDAPREIITSLKDRGL